MQMEISFDEKITSKNTREKMKGLVQGRTRGRGRGRAMSRGKGSGFNRQWYLRVNAQPSAYKVAKSFNRGKDLIRRHNLFDESMKDVGLTGVETSTKLYISNLDYAVSNEDIKELFSAIGALKKSEVHYDCNGRPTGSAEVMFIRRSDAVAAMNQYNNVQLDGKTMRIEIIGTNSGLAVMPRISVVDGANGRVKRTVVMTPDFHHGLGVRGGAKSFKHSSGSTHGNFSQRGRGRGRGQQRKFRGGFGGRGFVKKEEMSVEQLNDDLDTYRMQ